MIKRGTDVVKKPNFVPREIFHLQWWIVWKIWERRLACLTPGVYTSFNFGCPGKGPSRGDPKSLLWSTSTVVVVTTNLMFGAVFTK
jgi:hypothetical protein